MLWLIINNVKIEKGYLLLNKAWGQKKNCTECKWSLSRKSRKNIIKKWDHLKTKIRNFKIREETKAGKIKVRDNISTKNGQFKKRV